MDHRLEPGGRSLTLAPPATVRAASGGFPAVVRRLAGVERRRCWVTGNTLGARCLIEPTEAVGVGSPSPRELERGFPTDDGCFVTQNASLGIENRRFDIERLGIDIENASLNIETWGIDIQNAGIDIENLSFGIENVSFDIEQVSLDIDRVSPKEYSEVIIEASVFNVDADFGNREGGGDLREDAARRENGADGDCVPAPLPGGAS